MKNKISGRLTTLNKCLRRKKNVTTNSGNTNSVQSGKANIVQWLTLLSTLLIFFVTLMFVYIPQNNLQVKTVEVASMQTEIQRSIGEVAKAKDNTQIEIANIDKRWRETEKLLSVKGMELGVALDAYKAINGISPKITVTTLSGIKATKDDEPSLLYKGKIVQVNLIIKNVGDFDVCFKKPKIKLYKNTTRKGRKDENESIMLEEKKDYTFIYLGPQYNFYAHPHVDNRASIFLEINNLKRRDDYNCFITWEYATNNENVNLAIKLLNGFISENVIHRISKNTYTFVVRLNIDNMYEADY